MTSATEVRLDTDGTLDEVVGHGQFHLEQMDSNCWFVVLGTVAVSFHARGKITANFEHRAAPAAAATPAPVYLVATGETHEGLETYTRHETKPPLCDAEVLYTQPEGRDG